MLEYLTIAIFILISVIIAVLIPTAAFVLGIKRGDAEKVSIYECGFNPFADSRQKFEVRFFLVAILFIIFDLEISFLFPWTVALSSLSTMAYWTMMVFIGILTIGLVYEWLKGGLEWE